MTITPAPLNNALALKALYLDAIARVRFNFVSFPSYFYTLTQFSRRPSSHQLRRNRATKKSFTPRISLWASVSRGI